MKSSNAECSGSASATSAPGIDELMATLQSALGEEQRRIAEQQEQMKRERARLEVERGLLQRSQVGEGDIIHLNVGGRCICTARRTLCLAHESLLEAMFSGRWDERLTRDDSGRAFLDVDPDLFTCILNWLRSFASRALSAEVPLPCVPAGKEEEFMGLVDYLQLHRHVPFSYHELFSPSLASQFIAISPSCDIAERTEGGVRKGRLQVAATQHSFYDVCVEVSLEIISFQQSLEEGQGGPMTLGFMARPVLEACLQHAGSNPKPTCQSTFHGWTTASSGSHTIHDGRKEKTRCSHSLLWSQGDVVTLQLDCRKHQLTPLLSLLNTTTGAGPQLRVGQAARRGAAAKQDGDRAGGGGGADAADARSERPAGPPVSPGGVAVAARGGAAANGVAAASHAGPAQAGSAAAAGGDTTGGAGAAADAAEASAVSGAAVDAGAGEFEWVLVVGLSHPRDKVRIHAARRRGMRPEGST